MQLTGAEVTLEGRMTFVEISRLSAQVQVQKLVTKACS
jgi:hypothetical protein